MRNKLYNIVYYPKQRAAAISGSRYLKTLTPKEALIALGNRRKRLIRKLEKCEQANINGKLERQVAMQKTRDLFMEIELCEHAIACIREYGLSQIQTARAGSELEHAA
jgi:hypothetical protein